jgi:hypothetical protein
LRDSPSAFPSPPTARHLSTAHQKRSSKTSPNRQSHLVPARLCLRISLSHTHQLDFSIPSVHLPDACQRLRRMKLLKGRRASLPGSSSTPSLPPSSFSEHLSPASSSSALASTIDVEHIAPVPPTTSHMPNKGRAGEGKFPPSSFSLGRSLGLGLNRKDKRKGRQISSEASTPSSQLAVEPVLTEDAVGHGAVGASRLSIPKPTLAPARPAS